MISITNQITLMHMLELALAAWIPWSALKVGTHYRLDPTIVFNSQITVPTQAELVVLAIDQIPELEVVRVGARLTRCTPSLARQQAELVLVRAEYGADLEPGCRMNFYLNIRSQYRPSLLVSAKKHDTQL